MGIDAKMYVRTMETLTDGEVRRLGYDLAAVFGQDRFFIDRDHGRRAVTCEDAIDQDGPTIHPKRGETLLEVHLWTRYYGPGYERGDLAFIVTLAAWLEKRVADCEVWYGGDSSGVIAKPFGPEERDALIAHAASVEGFDYRQRDDSFGKLAAKCDWCEMPMSHSASGGNASGFICLGCGLRTVIDPDATKDQRTAHAVGKWPPGRFECFNPKS